MRKIFVTVMAMFICLNMANLVDAATYSGSCGGNANWNLDTSTGKLTISGTGAIPDYSSSSSMPWYSYKDSIKSVTIEYGITSIGQHAFYKYALTSVTIPDSVTYIGFEAFRECYYLTSVTIPASVTYIGDFAFSYCMVALTSIIYLGTTDPGASSINVFIGAPLYCLLVPSDYTSNTFCGRSVIKGNSCPAATLTPSKSPTPSMSPWPTPSRSPWPTPSRSSWPTPSKSPAPSSSYRFTIIPQKFNKIKNLLHKLYR